MGDKRYLTEADYHGAPELPHHRPPTRREVWEHYSYVYRNLWEEERIRDFCKARWVDAYVSWYNRGWRKQPDWKEGDPVIATAVPSRPFFPGDATQRIVYDYLNRARQPKRMGCGCLEGDPLCAVYNVEGRCVSWRSA